MRKLFEVSGTIAGLFFEFSFCTFQDALSRVQSSLDQPQFIVMQAGGVFPYQEDGVLIFHCYDDDGAETMRTQALIGALYAVAELNFKFFRTNEFARVMALPVMNAR